MKKNVLQSKQNIRTYARKIEIYTNLFSYLFVLSHESAGKMIQRFTAHSETTLKPSLEQDEISEGLKVGEVYLQRLNRSDRLVG